MYQNMELKDLELTEDDSIHAENEELVFLDYFNEHTGNISELNTSITPSMEEPISELNKILSQYL